jgi:hypothetical protein
MNYNELASEQSLQDTKQALESNGFNVQIVDTAEDAKNAARNLIPKGSEVMTMTSMSLTALGLDEEFNNNEAYKSVRDKLYSLDSETQGVEKLKLGAAPEYTIGSVHAVTTDGKVLIASNTGSQMPAYVYGSAHVVWIVGAQKIVKDLDDGIKRIYDYVLPLESERAHKAYGVEASFVSKLLIFNREVNPQRINIILVKEQLGF